MVLRTQQLATRAGIQMSAAGMGSSSKGSSRSASADRRMVVLTTGCFLLPPLTVPRVARAVDKGGVQWSIQLPDTFSVSRQLASIVRVRTETMLAAEDAASGAQAKLLLLPFGQQAGGSLPADDQLALARFFFERGERDKKETESAASIMCASAARSPTIVSLSSVGHPSVVAAANGRRYLQYGYESERCLGEIDDGECLGQVSKRRTLATVTMSSISQYRTNTERERMRELGQERNVQVLWLLTLSAPAGTYSGLQTSFQKVADSFAVPDLELQIS
eukprot:CAMPEP_0174698540 /NCGR_PEP_ID=MMETSP1094-20130205/4111_1 /TAXON_ID=156173 /ORGANISM="Chrysochromulina brevifilum, Strain UTEX LB 985" /LENGTH=276 /DNA_ID=CAMNT_0015895733 /DNA_START=66 /DNA_END=896 /DNA_ORIENTATION=-